MKSTWLLVTLTISLGLMLVQKSYELDHLQNYLVFPRTLKIPSFKKAKSSLSSEDQDLLEIWESMLTGNTRPLNKLIKERFSRLGLRHLFTPSGLHLGALLYPSLKLIRGTVPQFLLLTFLAALIFPLSGFVALKRMISIKWVQRIMGHKEGFILALFLDILFGSFQVSPLSFTYSFLFLGIMYSGTMGIGRIFWFFIGQGLIAFSQGVFIAPLLFIFSPLLSFFFVLALPVLFLLSFPFWDWQLHLGLFILRLLLKLIHLGGEITGLIPSWEMHIGLIVLLACLITLKRRLFVLCLILLSSSLNLDLRKTPAENPYEWVPQGQLLRIERKGEKTVLRFSDGKCEAVLVRGYWWKKCSPRRGSRKKLMKLSYPSSERRRSSLHG